MTRLSPRLPRLLALALGLAAAAACSGGPTATAGAGQTGSPSAAPSVPAPVSPAASAGATPAPVSDVAATASPAPPSAGPHPELPRGGSSIFPEHVVVMYYGTSGTGALGVLGETTPEKAAERLEKAAAPFATAAKKPVLPAFELITTVASSSPGKDGTYSTALAGEQVQKYIDVARKHKMLVVLDFQPGRATFLEQVKQYEKYLKQPDVGVALDPEWKLAPNQQPVHQIGTSKAAPINDVSAYLSDLVQQNNLPEKIFLVHQFKAYQLPDRDKIATRPGLANVLHVDGFGPRGAKYETYKIVHSKTDQFVNGFKLFYDEDPDLLSPAEALKVKPQPLLFSYQ